VTRLSITLKKSTIGYRQDQADTVRSLGLKRLHQTVERPDTPVVRGMVHKIRHLLQVEEIPEAVTPRRRRTTRKPTPDSASLENESA